MSRREGASDCRAHTADLGGTCCLWEAGSGPALQQAHSVPWQTLKSRSKARTPPAWRLEQDIMITITTITTIT